MLKHLRPRAALVTTVVLIAGLPNTASAYIDPTSGGLFLQFLLAGVAGVAVVIKMKWHRFKGFFTRRSKRGEEAQG